MGERYIFFPDKRIIVQQRVTPESGEVILSVREEVGSKVKLSGLIEPDKIHLTIFHFGKPAEVLADIRRVHPDLKDARFNESAEDFFDSCVTLANYPEVAATSGLAIFGDKDHPIAALKLRPLDRDMTIARWPMLQGIRELLRACGVEDVEEFLRSNQNFKWHSGYNSYNPHISLGSLERGGKLPSFKMKAALICLEPPTITNVRPID